VSTPVLPTREQLRDLNSFVDGRAYQALGPALRVPGHEPLMREDQRAAVREAVGAVSAAARHLCQVLWQRLGEAEPGPGAHAAWAAYRALAAPWQDHPDLAPDLRALLQAETGG
jgi:hypothetical protein